MTILMNNRKYLLCRVMRTIESIYHERHSSSLVTQMICKIQ